MFEFLKQLTNPESIIHYGGITLLLFVVFAETGLFVGFFLPGDSLIFISGMITITKPELLGVNLPVLIISLITAAVTGSLTGFLFGKKVGPALFKRDDSILFKKKYLVATEAFYQKNGGKTLIIGRFLPIIRTFSPILAGIIKMEFRVFMIYNFIGGAAWIILLSGIGYFLGRFIWVQNNIGLIVIGLIVITLIPLIIPALRKKSSK